MTETKEYSDGTSATGTAPLPDLSPRQQDTREALQHLDDIEAVMGGNNGPSIRLRALVESLGAQRRVEGARTMTDEQNDNAFARSRSNAGLGREEFENWATNDRRLGDMEMLFAWEAWKESAKETREKLREKDREIIRLRYRIKYGSWPEICMPNVEVTGTAAALSPQGPREP